MKRDPAVRGISFVEPTGLEPVSKLRCH